MFTNDVDCVTDKIPRVAVLEYARRLGEVYQKYNER